MIYLYLYVSIKNVTNLKMVLASYKDLKVIGITGSYGKTSSKNILNEILFAKSSPLYEKLYNERYPLLRKAYERSNITQDPGFVEFIKKNEEDTKK